jgi:hypothetical protein
MATDIIQHSLEQAIHSVMQEWTETTIAQLKKAIADKDIELTGNLKQSLEAVVSGPSENIAAKISMIFATYGRFHDMRYRHKMPPTAAMYQFIQKVGLSNFKFVPGYKKEITPIGVSQNTKKLNAEEYVMKRIARAIAYSRLKKDWQENKRKEWWNITINRNIVRLKQLVITKMQQELGEAIRKEFSIQ